MVYMEQNKKQETRNILLLHETILTALQVHTDGLRR